MIGVLVLALGLPPMFESIDQGVEVDNGVMVLGYVIMRVGLIALLLPPSPRGPARRADLRDDAVRRPARLDRPAPRQDVDRRDVLGRRRPHPDRAGRAGRRRTSLRRHAVAPPPRRRAVRAPDDHHARRGHPRHRRRARRRRARRGMDDGDGTRRARGSRAHLRHVVDVLRDPYGDLLHRFRERSFGWGYGHIPLFASLAATGLSTSPPWPSSTRPTSVWWRSWHRPPCRSRCTCSRCMGSTAC